MRCHWTQLKKVLGPGKCFPTNMLVLTFKGIVNFFSLGFCLDFATEVSARSKSSSKSLRKREREKQFMSCKWNGKISVISLRQYLYNVHVSCSIDLNSVKSSKHTNRYCPTHHTLESSLLSHFHHVITPYSVHSWKNVFLGPQQFKCKCNLGEVKHKTMLVSSCPLPLLRGGPNCIFVNSNHNLTINYMV